MMKFVARLFLAVASTCLFAGLTNTVDANGWGYGSGGSSGGSWGSSGGRYYASSGGSFGSSGGRYYASSGGSYGSSGGYYRVGPIRRVLRRVHHRIHHHSSGGYSSGGRYYGSRGGSSGGYYVVHYGSSGGSSGGRYSRTYSNPPISGGYYSPSGGNVDPSKPTPAEGNPGPEGNNPQENQKPPANSDGNANPKQPGGGGSDGTGLVNASMISPSADAWLNVTLPEEAKVYVNGRLTKTPGAKRQFVSRDLLAGEKYTYEVRAEIERDGKTLEQTKVVDLTAGANKNLSFDFGESPELITSLTINVPADAKVILGDVPTSSVGPIRYYSTRELKKGESWKDYKVQVSVNRNGKTLSREQTVNVAAGKSVKLTFDFDKTASDDQVASRDP